MRERVVELDEHMQTQRGDFIGWRFEIRHGDDCHASIDGRSDAVLAVLERKTMSGRGTQALGREPINRGIGLAAGNLVAACDGVEEIENAHSSEPSLDLL